MFARRCNLAMVTLDKVLADAEQPDDGLRHRDQTDEAQLKRMIEQHGRLSGSERAKAIMADWAHARLKFVKVFPNEYRRALKDMAATRQKEAV